MQRIITIFLILFLAFPPILFAQAKGDGYLEDKGKGLWKENLLDGFEDSFGDDFLSSGSGSSQKSDTGSGKSEFETGGGDYLSEEELLQRQSTQQLTTSTGKKINIKAAIAESAPLLPKNIAWGAGTGLMLGAWLAMISSSSSSSSESRQNAQYIGSGIVFGGLMGFLVGSKPVYLSGGRISKNTIPQKKSNFMFNIANSDQGLATQLNFKMQF
ncbi:MAG: hypothetical protein ACI86H_000696 [bacterium]|jgi:hypothetical protein